MNNSKSKKTSVYISSIISLILGASALIVIFLTKDKVNLTTTTKEISTTSNQNNNTDNSTSAQTSDSSSVSTNSSTSTTPNSTIPTSTTPTTTTTPVATTSTYKDGTYTKKVNFSVPKGGQDTLTVTITLTSDTISNLSVTGTYTDRESAGYLSDFKSSAPNAFNNKKITSIGSSRIAGASLTSEAFYTAISAIKSDAQ